MVQKIRSVLGRIDFRLLLLLVAAVVLASFAISQAGKTPASTPTPTDNNPTASTWDDLLKQYLACREGNYMLMVPPWYLNRATVEGSLKTYGLASFQQDPDWYWNFEGGLFVYTNKSALAKLVTNGTQIVIYEDMANQELLILDQNSGKEEIVYKAPAWPSVGTTENYADYLVRELSKRRVAWRATLKDKTLAAQEAQQAAQFSPKGGGGVGIESFTMQDASNALGIISMQRQTNGLHLEIAYPASYSGTTWSAYSFEMPRCMDWSGGGTNGGGNPPPPTNGCTNCAFGSCGDVTNTFMGLGGHSWTLVNSNLVLTGATQTAWIDTRPLGFDPATNPVNRVYGFGANAVDSDGDTLSDAREVFSTKTRADLWDTDGDGAGDGAEVSHGTNPLNNPGDSDGDGLSDDLEIVLGTDPWSADSDFDWVSDGYEVQQGFNPLSATSAPMLQIKVNDGAMYTASTNVIVSFPGLVATQAVLSESWNFTNSTAASFTNPMSFSFHTASNGDRFVYAKLRRNGYEESPPISDSITLDTVPPRTSIATPTNGTITSRGWVSVQGGVTDDYSAARVFVNGEWVDGIEQGSFWQAKVLLQPGSNAILVTAQDEAGNQATQAVTIIQNFTGDTSAPMVSLTLPKDYQITGGTTNWFNATTFGSNPTLYVNGTINDDSANVSFTVVSPGQTNGPFGGVVAGTQVWGVVTLFPGTNAVTVTGSDAAGNTYSTNYTVIRDTNFFLNITSPGAYEAVNSPSTTVSGVASPRFSNATINVNGISATVSNHGSNITFSTSTQVPISIDLTMLLVTAELGGKSYYADPPNGYEVVAWHADWSSKFNDHAEDQYGHSVTTDNFTEADNWDPQAKIYTSQYQDEYHNCYYCDDHSSCSGWAPTYYQCSDTTDSDTITAYMPSGPRGLLLGQQNYSLDGQSCGLKEKDVYSESLTFIKHWPTQETQTVVFQFKGFDIGRKDGEAIDPNTITYRGQTGFWYNGNMAFIVPLKTETERTIVESDFHIPAYSKTDSYGWWTACNPNQFENGKWVYFTDFTNHEIKILQSDQLWWFGGKNAANYSEAVTLSADGVTSGTFVWTVVNGTGRVLLNNGGDDATTITATDDNTVTIKSTDRSTSLLDSSVRLTWNGRFIADYPLTVYAPLSVLQTYGPVDSSFGIGGYMTQYRFKVLDQFGKLLPKEIEVNEWFGTWYSDWTNENWPPPDPNGMMTGGTAPIQFSDTYAYTDFTATPGPVDPSDSHADEPVQHAVQIYYAGSLTPGEGLPIKAHTVQDYRGKGRQLP